MHPTKAPGPYGLPSLFFQKYWSIVGRGVTKLAMDILNHYKNPVYRNSAFITLIPKHKNPSTPKYFRPISMCNMVMKIVTRAIANRLKGILPYIISEEQSAFVKGRLITDNVMIFMECFHWIKNKNKGKKETMGLKLDMSKAYDKIEWDFVLGALKDLEFPPPMIH